MKKRGKIKNKGLFAKILSVSLCVCLVVPMLALTGCEQTYDQLKKETVQFNKEGKYTVKFSQGDMLDILDNGEVQDTSAKPACEFKDITKDDVNVMFEYFTGEVVTDAQGNATDELKVGKKNAEITNFVNDGKEITISFDDEEKFANNVNRAYAIVIPKAKSVVIVQPKLPDNTLSSTTKEVSSDATENTLVIESKEGKFNPNITKDNITLDYSFKDMQVVSLEPKDNKLTIKLSGKPVIIP